MLRKNIQRRQLSSPITGFPSQVHPLLQRIYTARQVRSPKELENELSHLYPASLLKGIDEAVQRLAQSVYRKEKVIIVGDFDADGATSSALALLALNHMGLSNVSFLVPNRFEYGYGLTTEIVDVAARQKPALIVTVDNGISSLEGVAKAGDYAIDVIVTDHHLPGSRLPEACAIVNPNQPGCEFPSKCLAGVGVIFYLMTALRTHLKEQGWFEQQGIDSPNMANYLDLVALGTVADVVPLDHNNRILVHQGLRRIRAAKARPGILALLEIANRKRERVVASDLGFAIGPRLNAAGRLDDMSHGIACLLCEDPALAKEMALELDELNRNRRQIEQGMQSEALLIVDNIQLADGGGELPTSLCLYDPQWHQGVIGILASRIKDRYHRPVIAFAKSDDEGELKGSARSIQGIHIRDILDAVATKNPGLISRFGGHAMAAGLTLAEQDLASFTSAFDCEISQLATDDMLNALIMSDGELSHDELNLFVAQLLREAGPWGQQFPEPVFDGYFYLVEQRLVGKKHLKMVLALDENKQQLLDAIAFNVDLDHWPNHQLDGLRMAYRLDVNEYRNQQTVQLMVEYMEKA